MKSKVQTAEFKPKPVAQRHHLVSGTLALLKYLVIYMNVKQGSGPNRGRGPVEWREILFVHPFVRPPSLRPEPGPGRPKPGPGRP